MQALGLPGFPGIPGFPARVMLSGPTRQKMLDALFSINKQWI